MENWADMNERVHLDLNLYKEQSMSAGTCHHCAEAATVLLVEAGHECPAEGQIMGEHVAECTVTLLPSDPMMLDANRDMSMTAEWAAYGAAIWTVPLVSEYYCAARSRKGTGFDLWLKARPSDDNFHFLQNESYVGRLEVSGVAIGGVKELQSRTSQKLAQLARSDASGLPGFVFIAEFSGFSFNFKQKAV